MPLFKFGFIEILLCQEDWGQYTRYLFNTGALVLFVIPATCVRALPAVAYSGTVAGFTAALLLIDDREPEDLRAVSDARIVQTFAGVGILIAVELFVFPSYAAPLLRRTMTEAVGGVPTTLRSALHGLRALAALSEDDSRVDDGKLMPLKKRATLVAAQWALHASSVLELPPLLGGAPAARLASAEQVRWLLHAEDDLLFAAEGLAHVTKHAERMWRKEQAGVAEERRSGGSHLLIWTAVAIVCGARGAARDVVRAPWGWVCFAGHAAWHW